MTTHHYAIKIGPNQLSLKQSVIKIRLVNTSGVPLKLRRNEHFCQVRHTVDTTTYSDNTVLLLYIVTFLCYIVVEFYLYIYTDGEQLNSSQD